jgi:bifunctional UDP-N-acetylglucosamine pyrophosphorylase/glucosamine-1-phosphate N-acetyltransferase
MRPDAPRPAAIVLAAGKGTRMRSERPKVLFPVLGRAIVRRVVDAAQQAGCEPVVVVVGHGAESVRQELAGVAGIAFAVQEGMQGTGQAVSAARGAADWRGRTVLVLPGDVPLMSAGTLRGLLEAHGGGGAGVAPARVATVATFEPPDPFGYGRVIRAGDDSGRVLRIVEQKDASAVEQGVGEVNSSLYAFDGSFLFGEDGRSGALSTLTTQNRQQEYLLTDVVGIADAQGRLVGAWQLPDPAEVAGINDRAQLADLERELRERLNLAWMRAGVSMDEPESTRIEESVRLGEDVTLGAAVELRGATRLGRGVTVGRGSVLVDVEVEDGARIGDYVVARRARVAAGADVLPFSLLSGIDEKKPERSGDADLVRVGAGARVGPFSHLRQSSDLGAGAHVGNFVELKKTAMGEGAKANHLAYLGDAEIGARSNVGAGVITCNYDGFAKHRSIVGEDVFVGTDSHLVAPVRLGDGAYVATGTTVTRDVPKDALAIGRARQENKDGYAPRIKEQLRRRAEQLAAQKARAAVVGASGSGGAAAGGGGGRDGEGGGGGGGGAGSTDAG